MGVEVVAQGVDAFQAIGQMDEAEANRLGEARQQIHVAAGGGLIGGSQLLNVQDTTTTLTLEDNTILQVASGMIVSSNFGIGTNQEGGRILAIQQFHTTKLCS